MKLTRREFTKASLGAATLAALGGSNALAGPELHDSESDSFVG